MSTNLSALEAAMSEIETGVRREITAPKAYADHKAREAALLPYAEARADLEARARAGQTVQGRNSKGQFLRGAKVFTAGKAPAAPARKVAKVEAPRPAPRVHVPASAALSAEV